MAMRIKLKRGGEVSLSISDGGGLILMTEHKPALAVVEMTLEEAKQLAESLLSAVGYA